MRLHGIVFCIDKGVITALGTAWFPSCTAIQTTKAGAAQIMTSAIGANPANRARAHAAVSAVPAIVAKLAAAVIANTTGFSPAVTLGATTIVFNTAFTAVAAAR